MTEDIISLNASIASSHLYKCMYAEPIDEDDAGRIWFRYSNDAEVLCSHIAREFDTTHTQVFLAGVLYDNDYCGTKITSRLSVVINKAMMSDNSYLRQTVCNGATNMKLYTGRRTKFRMERSEIDSIRNEAKKANLSLADLGLMRFYCWISDLMGADTELVNINKFKEFNRSKQYHNDRLEDLEDYLIDLEVRV